MFHVQNNEISTDKGDGKKEEENKMKQKMERKKNNCSYGCMGRVQTAIAASSESSSVLRASTNVICCVVFVFFFCGKNYLHLCCSSTKCAQSD